MDKAKLNIVDKMLVIRNGKIEITTLSNIVVLLHSLGFKNIELQDLIIEG